jgi:DNA-binding transcriptional ArsR family regulator
VSEPTTAVVDGEIDELLRALAHPARRELIRLCWSHPVAAGALVDALGLAAASTSEHLKVLRKTGLLVMSRQGTFRRYQAEPRRLAVLRQWLAAFPAGSSRAAAQMHDIDKQ